MMNKLLPFLERLDTLKIYYKLNKVRDSIMVEIVVPGERWEVEFFSDHIESEIFKSDGSIYGEEQLAYLFEKFSD